MKKINLKTMILFGIVFALIIGISLAVYAKAHTTDFDLPDVLEKTVGTVSNTSLTTGVTDGDGYQAVFTRTFKSTTEADYAELMEHYKSASTGEGENDSLLYDWGWLYVTRDGDAITIQAFFYFT